MFNILIYSILMYNILIYLTFMFNILIHLIFYAIFIILLSCMILSHHVQMSSDLSKSPSNCPPSIFIRAQKTQDHFNPISVACIAVSIRAYTSGGWPFLLNGRQCHFNVCVCLLDERQHFRRITANDLFCYRIDYRQISRRDLTATSSPDLFLTRLTFKFLSILTSAIDCFLTNHREIKKTDRREICNKIITNREIEVVVLTKLFEVYINEVIVYKIIKLLYCIQKLLYNNR